MDPDVELSRGRVWTRVLSITARAAFAIAVLIYVAFYTEDFTLFQKLVVLLVAVILYGAAESIVRAVRGAEEERCSAGGS